MKPRFLVSPTPTPTLRGGGGAVPPVAGSLGLPDPPKCTAREKACSMEKLKTYPEHETRLNSFSHRTEKPPYVPEGRRLMQTYFVRDLDYCPKPRTLTPATEATITRSGSVAHAMNPDASPV